MGTSTVNQVLPPLPPLPHFLHNTFIHPITHFPLQTLYIPPQQQRHLSLIPHTSILPYVSIHSGVPSICLIFSNKACLSHLNSSHLTRKCSTSSTSLLLHNTHLSSSHILHRFLSSKRPADPVLSLNRSLIPFWPTKDLVSNPASSFTIWYHFKLLFPSISSIQSLQFFSWTFSFHSFADPVSLPSNPYLLNKRSYSPCQLTLPQSCIFFIIILTSLLSSSLSSLLP